MANCGTVMPDFLRVCTKTYIWANHYNTRGSCQTVYSLGFLDLRIILQLNLSNFLNPVDVILPKYHSEAHQLISGVKVIGQGL